MHSPLSPTSKQNRLLFKFMAKRAKRQWLATMTANQFAPLSAKDRQKLVGHVPTREQVRPPRAAAAAAAAVPPLHS